MHLDFIITSLLCTVYIKLQIVLKIFEILFTTIDTFLNKNESEGGKSEINAQFLYSI